MGRQQSQVATLSSEFARMSGLAAAQANAQRRAISEANIEAAKGQASLAATQERSRVAQAFARHKGTLAVNAAFRGTSAAGGSTRAATLSAALRAGDEVAVARANEAATVQAARAANQFVEEDVTLASLQGGLQGLSVGSQIASSLQAATQVQQRQSQRLFDPGSGQFVGFETLLQDVAVTPGLSLDLGSLGASFGLDLGG